MRVYFVYEGYFKQLLGRTSEVQEAVKMIKEHHAKLQRSDKARWKKSLGRGTIRIDYGAKDCYYVMESER